MASTEKLIFSLIFFIILGPMVGEEDIQGNREGHRRLFLWIFIILISQVGVNGTRIWLTLGFPFFLLSFSFSFHSVLYHFPSQHPLWNLPLGPGYFSFSLYCH